MRRVLIITLTLTSLLIFNCKKEEYSERFNLLTTPVWTSDSLLANGMDAAGPGQLLEKFKGDAEFKKDGTGYFGKFTGSWRFAQNETQLTIFSDSLPIPSLTTNIIELNEISLKITTAFPDFAYSPPQTIDIRMTFKTK